MVKLDIYRDYYGDLELSPTSSSAEIKKQYKKLALLYHPDRNFGSNNSDSTKFQKIQSAYEILNDPLERAKYDANRRASAYSNVSSSYSRFGAKGNPWSNAGKEYPPPPKPPTARNRQSAPPPPSNGARRYEKFSTPPQSAYQASQEGSQARKATYDAWEKMRGHHGSSTAETNAKKTPKVPTPSPRDNAKSDRKERKNGSPSPLYTFVSPNDKNARSSAQDSNTSSVRKKGFMPSTPGGDEKPAPRGYYSTKRANPNPPPIPPRNPESSDQTSPDEFSNDGNQVDPDSFFPQRTSTPYATHGGERFNPFEVPRGKISRSKSTCEKGKTSKSKENMFYANTNSNTKSYTPPRAHSFGGHPSPILKPVVPSSDTEDSDSEDTIDIPFTPKRREGSRTKPNGVHRTTSMSSRKPSRKSPRTGRRNSGRINLESEKNPNIFSFGLEDDTFASTQPVPQESSSGISTENISTKFSAEEWDGKFSAGSSSEIFKLNGTSGSKASHRAQSGNRARTRSPTKPQPISKQTAKVDNNKRSPRNRRFSVDEWAETFKPQTFMPPHLQPQPIAGPGTNSTSGRKRPTPGPRPVLGSNFPTIDDSLNTKNINSKTNQDSSISNANSVNIATPEPMDIDTPIELSSNPIVPIFSERISKASSETQKSETSKSELPLNEGEIQTSALKVNFSDLNIKDIDLDFPLPPNPPVLPQEKILSSVDYLQLEARYTQYMFEWDQFDRKFLLHLVARKNKNESLGDKRWKGKAAEYYRSTIREDQMVLQKWAEAKYTHEKVMTGWIVFKDVTKILGMSEEQDKTHQEKSV